VERLRGADRVAGQGPGNREATGGRYGVASATAAVGIACAKQRIPRDAAADHPDATV